MAASDLPVTDRAGKLEAMPVDSRSAKPFQPMPLVLSVCIRKAQAIVTRQRVGVLALVGSMFGGALSIACASSGAQASATSVDSLQAEQPAMVNPSSMGASPSGVPAATPSPCDSPEHRAFDFWLGHWEVYLPNGKVGGYNTIEKLFGGCVIQESYATVDGRYAGRSLNIYDASRQRWHQTWVDTSGLLLTLEGGMSQNTMVMRGTTVAKEGTVLNEIRWENRQDGTVTQTWTTSTDNGKTWSTAFVGNYRRK